MSHSVQKSLLKGDLCALLHVQVSYMTDSLRAAGVSLCGICNEHKYTLKRICCARLLKCFVTLAM